MSNTMIASYTGVKLKGEQSSKKTAGLPQIVSIYSPVSDAKKNSKEIAWNIPKIFNSSDDVLAMYGVCPAFIAATILLPKNGGGIGQMAITPIREENESPTSWDLIITGDNAKDVDYNIEINGNQFFENNEIRFVIGKDMTLEQKINEISTAINSVEYAPISATTKHLNASGKKIITNSIQNRIANIFDIEDGAAVVVTNSAAYPIKLNTNGTRAKFTTSDLSANFAAIYQTASGSFKISSDNEAPKQVTFSNAGGKSTIITTSVKDNFNNLLQKLGNFKIKQGSKEYIFRLDTNAEAGKTALAELTLGKITSLQSVNNGQIDVTTNNLPNPITITCDFTTISSIDDVLNIINTQLQKDNVPARATKDINTDKIIFETLSKNASSTVTLSATNPVTGTDISTSTFFDISTAIKQNGLEEITTKTPAGVVDQVLQRLNRQLALSGVTDFRVSKNFSGNELAFVGSTDPEELTIENVSGDNFIAPDMFNIASAFKYTASGTIDNQSKLLNYLSLQLKLLDSCSVEYDLATHKFIFTAKNKGASNSITFSNGDVGTNLNADNYLKTSDGVLTAGKNKKTKLQEIADELAASLKAANSGVDVIVEANELEFINRKDLGSSSILTITQASQHTGEQLADPKYFNADTMIENQGHDDTNSISLTTKWSGVTSADNKIIINEFSSGGGVNFIINKAQSGHGKFNLNEAFKSIGDNWFPWIINAYGMHYRTIFRNFIGSVDRSTGLYTINIFKPAVAITGTTEANIDNLLDLTKDLIEDSTTSVIAMPNYRDSDLQIAASAARLIAETYSEKPHGTTEGKTIFDVHPPKSMDIGKMKELSNRNILLLGGVSTIELDTTTGTTKAGGFITPRRPANQSPTEVDFKYIRNIQIDFQIAFKVKDIEKKYVQFKTLVADDSPAEVDDVLRIESIKGLMQSLFSDLEKQALIFSNELCKKTLEVMRDPINPQRIIIKFSYQPSGIVGAIDNVITKQFYLTAGE